MMRHWIARAVALGVLLSPWTGAFAAREVEVLAGRVTKLERALDNRGLVDLLQRVEALQQEVQRLQGLLENQSYTIEQLRKSQVESYLNIDRRVQAIEQSAAGVAGQPAPPGADSEPPLATRAPAAGSDIAGRPAPDSGLQVEVEGAGPAAATGAPGGAGGEAPLMPDTPTSDAERAEGGGAPAAGPVTRNPALAAQPGAAGRVPEGNATPAAGPSPSLALRAPTVDSELSENAYSEAFDLLKAGQYEASIAAFRGFLQQYPNSQHGDNSQYWLGEAYYVLRKFEPAIAEYQKLIEDYPNSNKQSHALLKIGYSYHELGLTDRARAVLEDLRLRFPGTTAAHLAEERLQRITASPQ